MNRILAPDLARGMMLLFIALANVSIYLFAANESTYSTHPVGEGLVDTVLASLVILTVDGHVYPMFAFLFGYGMTQFALSRMSSGTDPKRVSKLLLKRHLWMLVFGAVHALLLFAGDIIGAYALTGLVLAAFILRGSDRAIKTTLWAVGATVFGLMLLVAAGAFTLEAMIPDELLEMPMGDDLPAGLPTDDGSFDFLNVNWLMAGIDNYFLAMLVRFIVWVVSSVGAVLSLVVPFAVLLGGLAARYRWLEGKAGVPLRRFTLGRVALWGITFGIVAALPSALAHLGVLEMGDLGLAGAAILAQVGGVAGGVGYIALFALIAARPSMATNPAVTAIASVGKRSLSSYLIQSLIMAPLLSAWGLGLGGSLTSSGAFLIAILSWFASLAIAVVLERAGKRGPAETLLRALQNR